MSSGQCTGNDLLCSSRSLNWSNVYSSSCLQGLRKATSIILDGVWIKMRNQDLQNPEQKCYLILSIRSINAYINIRLGS